MKRKQRKTGIICIILTLNTLTASPELTFAEEKTSLLYNTACEYSDYFFADSYFAGGIQLTPKQDEVLVLTYHLISEKPGDWNAFCVSPTVFEQDI